MGIVDKGTFLILTKRKVGIEQILRNYLYVKSIEVIDGRIIVEIGVHFVSAEI